MSFNPCVVHQSKSPPTKVAAIFVVVWWVRKNMEDFIRVIPTKTTFKKLCKLDKTLKLGMNKLMFR